MVRTRPLTVRETDGSAKPFWGARRWDRPRMIHVSWKTCMRASAAFTIVQNESFFLPIWLSYYAQFFDRSDLYVLDHASTDGSTDSIDARCVHIRVHRERSFDHSWLRGTVSAFQAFLLQSYERVLFAEADEIVAPDPAFHAGLGDYLAQCRAPVARCTGFEVVHYPDEEPPLQPDQPLLAQRQYWHASALYSKPLIAARPITWSLGFHTTPDFPEVLPDPHLLLIHLHRLDYDACVARHRRTASATWNEDDLRAGHGMQNRLVDGDRDFMRWYYNGVDNTGRARIPPRVRALL
jgi:hypothetical protein